MLAVHARPLLRPCTLVPTLPNVRRGIFMLNRRAPSHVISGSALPFQQCARVFHVQAPLRAEIKPSPSKQEQPTGEKTSILSLFRKSPQSTSSFLKVLNLAKPEKKPLLTAIGLLLVSSSVSMSVPFTIGKLIDFFASTNPQIPFGLSVWEASACLLLLFTTGAVANAGRSILMRMSGQRIVARLRERTYAAALKQEVEFVERGEGDVLSRLSVDTSIVGERSA
ncbi:hypothetical protein C0992_004949 [Termitomyces sp. T32_za158]|nr:hypothetical protein C0992_004949 [Termitomyces sp. T32_za158]